MLHFCTSFLHLNEFRYLLFNDVLNFVIYSHYSSHLYLFPPKPKVMIDGIISGFFNMFVYCNDVPFFPEILFGFLLQSLIYFVIAVFWDTNFVSITPSKLRIPINFSFLWRTNSKLFNLLKTHRFRLFFVFNIIELEL